MLEFWGCEDAPVEADDGDFDGGREDKVGELVGEEDLVLLDEKIPGRYGFGHTL